MDTHKEEALIRELENTRLIASVLSKYDDFYAEFKYKNYKGEIAWRKATLLEVRQLGNDPYHPQGTWVVEGYDLDKEKLRNYAIADILEWGKYDSWD